MDIWLESEIRIRRDGALENARAIRAARSAGDGRSTALRIRIANGAQAMSDALGTLAEALRGDRPGQAARR